MTTKKCGKCNYEKNISDFYYHRGRRMRMASCKKCNANKCADYQRGKRKEGDMNFILRARAAGIRRECKFKRIPAMEKLGSHLLDLWNKQEGRCFYSQIKMDVSGYRISKPTAVTIDRVIPNLGYMEGNVVLCCSIINRMKQNLSLKDLKKWCRVILSSKAVNL